MHRGENAKEASQARWEKQKAAYLAAVRAELDAIEASYRQDGPTFANIIAETFLESYLSEASQLKVRKAHE